MAHAIILAAGESTRMGQNKILLPLLGRPLLSYTLKVFESSPQIENIVVVTRKEMVDQIKKIKEDFGITKLEKIIEGGKERQDSVFNGLEALKGIKEDEIIAIHNGSNPLVTVAEINSCIADAKKNGAAILGFPLKDTIKKAKEGFVEKTLERKEVFQIQTPQCATLGILKSAHQNAKKKKIIATDDASLIEILGKKVKITNCSPENFKVTTPEDIIIAEGILSRRNGGNQMRIGLGQDSHAFIAKGKKPLVIGGYTIPNEAGFLADSDGDVILHAIFNAISSAMGGRSLGITADALCKKGITDSKEYLNPLLKKMNEKNFKINNLSISLEGKRPKMEPHHENITKSISKILGLKKDQIGLTFTTGDGLTSFGKGEGMQCLCVVMIRE